MVWLNIPVAAWKDNPRPIGLGAVSAMATPLLMVCNRFGWAFVALGVSLAAVALVGIGNWDLLKYLKVIAGKPDSPSPIPRAIFQSAILFFAVINLYGALYCAQMGWLPACASILAQLPHELVHWFYFSTVTITTLGYGEIVPASIASRLTAAFEALNGLVAFGVFTGAVTTYLSRE